jgi:hypothetical protein
MVLIHQVEQGTPEWFAVRLGIPTASNFAKIITSTGKPSTSAAGYMDQLLADWLAGEVTDAVEANYWMDRGTEMEGRAREAYSLITGHSVEHVGFITDGKRQWGCSPDGLIGDDGGLEIKCPKASTLVSYYRAGKCPADYWPQVQGALWVTGRAWWEFLAYHPALRPFIVHVERDAEYIGKLAEAVEGFVAKLTEAQEALKEWRM